MSPVRTAAGVGRTSIVCQCMSIKPGISVRPPPATTFVLARRSIRIGVSEIFSIVLPRTRTFMVTLNVSLVPSKIRTFSNSVPVCSADAAPCADTAEDSPNPTSGITATKALRDMDFIIERNQSTTVLPVQQASAAVARCGIGRNPELKADCTGYEQAIKTPTARSDKGHEEPRNGSASTRRASLLYLYQADRIAASPRS